MSAKKNRDFRWDERTKKAARLIAEGELLDHEVAATVGVHPSTIWRWKAIPQFARRVAKLSERIEAAIQGLPISVRVRRVKRLNDVMLAELGEVPTDNRCPVPVEPCLNERWRTNAA